MGYDFQPDQRELMATVLLVRHGRTTANATGTLAGRTAGVQLDERGHEQVTEAARRLSGLALTEIVSSPLERCQETAAAIANSRALQVGTDDALTECDYGQWQGGELAKLAEEPLWKTVQTHPSAAHFPGGESIRTMQSRAVAAVRERDAQIDSEHGGEAVWVAVSHGDIIKSVLADALGMHLDLFQRLSVHPASISIVRYGQHRPDVLAINTIAGDLSWLGRAAPAETVGGGSGAEPEGRS